MFSRNILINLYFISTSINMVFFMYYLINNIEEVNTLGRNNILLIIFLPILNMFGSLIILEELFIKFMTFNKYK